MKQIADTFDMGDWIAENKNYLIGGIIGLFLLTAFLWSKFATGANESDYVSAANNFTLFKKAITNPKASQDEVYATLDKLEPMLNKYNELRQKYDGDIAQLLLARNFNERALPFARRFLKNDHAPVLAPFAQVGNITVEVASGNKDRAIELGQELAKTAPQNTLLHAFNTLQLALLQNSPQEWEHLKTALRDKGFHTLSDIFTLGNVSLLQYIHSQSK